MAEWRDDRGKAARDLLGQQGEQVARKHGWETGDFVTALLRAMYAADQENLFLLSLGFPALAWAVNVWKNAEDGVAMLVRIAGWAEEES